MRIDPAYYKSFTVFWFGATVAAVADLDTKKAKVLVDGGRRIMDLVFEEFASFPKLKGNAFTVGFNLYYWAKEHKDPLEGARTVMEMLRRSYDKPTD